MIFLSYLLILGNYAENKDCIKTERWTLIYRYNHVLG